MIRNPRPGMRVRLSREGWRSVGECGGIKTPEEAEAAKRMTILHVSEVMTNDGSDVRMVTVDGPFTHLMLCNLDFDELPEAPADDDEIRRKLGPARPTFTIYPNGQMRQTGVFYPERDTRLDRGQTPARQNPRGRLNAMRDETS